MHPFCSFCHGRAARPFGQADMAQGPDASFMFNASVTGGHTFFLCNGTSYDSLIEVSDVTTEISFGFDDDSCRTVSGPSSITIKSLNAVSCSWSQFELDNDICQTFRVCILL